MSFKLFFSKQAHADMDELEKQPSLFKQCKAAKKALGLLEANSRHPSLQTHKFHSLKGVNGEDVFEAYAQNNTQKAYRIFFQYGPEKQALTILGIAAHP